jgi:hypothetical protein
MACCGRSKCIGRWMDSHLSWNILRHENSEPWPQSDPNYLQDGSPLRSVHGKGDVFRWNHQIVLNISSLTRKYLLLLSQILSSSSLWTLLSLRDITFSFVSVFFSGINNLKIWWGKKDENNFGICFLLDLFFLKFIRTLIEGGWGYWFLFIQRGNECLVLKTTILRGRLS